MRIMRRILGIFVMIAGIIGLLLGLAGLVGMWWVKPGVTSSIRTTVKALLISVDTSQKALVITDQALGTGIDSMDTLAKMLTATADTVGETQPVITQASDMMNNAVPAAMEAARAALTTAEGAARSVEGAVQSFQSFQAMLASAPLLSEIIPVPATAYNPATSLADSLGELSASIQDMPTTFKDMSASIDKADDNLAAVRSNLDLMSTNVSLISGNLGQYQTMISESQASLDNLKGILTKIDRNLDTYLSVAAVVLVLFFVWLLVTQVVIFSQGWELFQGTAGRMESGAVKAAEKVGVAVK
jgi:hypothetical protein